MSAQAVEIVQAGAEVLEQYALVPIAYMVRAILRVEPVDGGLGGLRMAAEAVAAPYWKDYDLDERPTDWPAQFDLTNWRFFLALEQGSRQPAGAAAVAWKTPGVNMLEKRADLAVLWDIRVRPERRGQGIGQRLFQAAEDWARSRGCAQIKVETQNTNPDACRFYARMGCLLSAIHRSAYPEPYQHEAMLLWYKDLTPKKTGL